MAEIRNPEDSKTSSNPTALGSMPRSIQVYFLILFATMGVVFYLGPAVLVENLTGLVKDRTEWEKGGFMFGILVVWIMAGVPAFVLAFMGTGFVMKSLALAVTVNFAAYCFSALLSYIIARLFQEPMRKYISLFWPRFLKGVKVLEKEPLLIILFRLIMFPLFLKNYSAGLLKLPLHVYILSVLLHGVQISLTFGWIGSVSKHAIRSHNASNSASSDLESAEKYESDNSYWLFGIGVGFTIIFMGAFWYFYRKEMRELQSLLGN